MEENGLEESGSVLSFSEHCVSGLIGGDMCRCWRCRGVEPEAEEAGWARVAELVSEGFSSETWRKMRIAAQAAQRNARP